MPDDDTTKPSYQARMRGAHARERFAFVLGHEPKMVSGKGRDYLLNFNGMKEAYEEALKSCPIAADAMLAMIWDSVRNYTTLELMAEDYEAKVDEEIDKLETALDSAAEQLMGEDF